VTETAERLKSELSRLPPKERAELAHFLIHSLDDEVDADAEAAWDAELAKRLEEINRGQAVGEPAAKVFGLIRQMRIALDPSLKEWIALRLRVLHTLAARPPASGFIRAAQRPAIRSQ
jgi:putative addiction module component (TIGR02574 family)